MLWISQNLEAQYTADRYRKNETPLPVRCKHFARLWPTVDLGSNKMMIAEVSGGSTLNYSPGRDPL